MPFSSEKREVESQCRISRTDLRREREKGCGGDGGGGGGKAEKRTTRRRRNAVRSHIGSDTSNPEAATPQIPPSCWTSCSLHNRIRMNRPSPTRLLLLVCVLHLASLFTPSAPLGCSIPFLSSFLTLFCPCLFLSLSLSVSSSLFLFPFPFADFSPPDHPLFVFFLYWDVPLAQRMPLDSSFP